jgi:hypothetical protein
LLASPLFLQRSAHRTFQLIDLVVSVIQRYRRAHRRVKPEAVHRRLRAMMTCAHGDAVLVEESL